MGNQLAILKRRSGSDHTLTSCKRRFNFFQFDPEAAHFDLIVNSSDKLKLLIGSHTHKIACAIQSTFTKRIGDESFCSLLRSPLRKSSPQPQVSVSAKKQIKNKQTMRNK